jgi:hypothetical protein
MELINAMAVGYEKVVVNCCLAIKATFTHAV